MKMVNNSKIRVAKTTWMFLVCVCLSASSLSAQEERITFSKQQITVCEAFSEIQKQTNYLISSSTNAIPMEKPVSLSSKQLPLRKAIDELLAHSNRTYLIKGRHILIVPVKKQGVPKPEIMIPEKVKVVKRTVQVPKLPNSEEAPVQQRIEKPIPDMTMIDYLQRKALRMEANYSSRPSVALRTNLLYGIGTLTPNIGLEFGLAARSSLLFTGSYNPWNTGGERNNNKKLNHWLAGLEYRFWTCERFNGHFFGLHGFYGNYNIAGYNVPFLLEKGAKDYRYQGYVVGGGISYGYHLMLGRRWSTEFNIGVGVGVTTYDKYDRRLCGHCREESKKRTFMSPTKAGISLIYIIQ